MTDPRFDETRDRTDPKRARALGAACATTGASGKRVEGQARADERRQERAAARLSVMLSHSTRAKRARGQYTGGDAAYGATEQERDTVRRACELRTAGYSLRIIAGQLADEGMLNRSGLPFHPQTLARIIAAADARHDYQVARAQTRATDDYDGLTGSVARF